MGRHHLAAVEIVTPKFDEAAVLVGRRLGSQLWRPCWQHASCATWAMEVIVKAGPSQWIGLAPSPLVSRRLAELTVGNKF